MKLIRVSMRVLLCVFSIFLFLQVGFIASSAQENTPQKEKNYSETQKKLIDLGVVPKEKVEEPYKEKIKKYQTQLRALGYYTIAIDGIVGPKTRQAIEDFQRDVDMPMTAKFDAETIERLSRPTLILNTQDFPPFHYKIRTFADKVYGPIPEVIKIVCLEAHLNCILRLYDWGHAQELVKEGRAHGMFVIGWNAERAKFLYRSLPIIETEYGFFVRDNDPLTFQQIEDINDYTVGVYGPSNTSKTLRRIENTLRNKGMRIYIKETKDDKPLFKELSESTTVRAVFSNKDVGNTIINGLGLENIRYAGQYKTLLYYVGFSKRLVNREIVDKFNEYFQKLQKEGIVQEVYANSGLIGEFGDSQKRVAKLEPKNTEEKEEKKERYEVKTLNDTEIILDNTTCLLWQKNGSEKPINWQEAKKYIESLNTNTYAGYTDWRLPKIQELSSLLEKDIQKSNRLYINPIFDAMQQVCWSSNGTDNTANTDVQYVDFYEGGTASRDQLDTSFVRAVRGTSCQEAR